MLFFQDQWGEAPGHPPSPPQPPLATIVLVEVNILFTESADGRIHNSDWKMRQMERWMLPPYYFYWFRIDDKHMTEP